MQRASTISGKTELLMERILKLHKKVASAKPRNNDEEVDGGGG
nr:hypothetical protein [Tanacetum cinerariifolium]